MNAEREKNSPASEDTGATMNPMEDTSDSLDCQGWFKAMRNPDAFELGAMNPNALWLLYVIAYRANWHGGFNRHGLQKGEAFIGDWKKLGLTRQQYRTALMQLTKFNFATIRTTNKGTIARLSDTRCFDINDTAKNQQINHQATIKQPSSNHQATTNEEYKNDKNEKNYKKENTKERISVECDGLPETPQAARNFCGAVGCPADFAEFVWHKANSMGWVGPNGQPITNFQSYLAVQWRYEQERLNRNRALSNGPKSNREITEPNYQEDFWAGTPFEKKKQQKT